MMTAGPPQSAQGKVSTALRSRSGSGIGPIGFVDGAMKTQH
jgi:hypothetical protein